MVKNVGYGGFMDGDLCSCLSRKRIKENQKKKVYGNEFEHERNDKGKKVVCVLSTEVL